MYRHCIEVIEVQARKTGPVHIDRFSQVNNARFGSVKSGRSEASEGDDSTLVVNVEEADGKPGVCETRSVGGKGGLQV